MALLEEPGDWQKYARPARWTSVPLLYTVAQACSLEKESRRKPGHLTPFGFRMFKTITRAKAIPAKRHRFNLYLARTRVHGIRTGALHRGVTGADKHYLFFFKIKCKNPTRMKISEFATTLPVRKLSRVQVAFYA